MANGVELATAYVNLTVSAKDVGSQTRKAFSGMERDADSSGKRAGKNFSGGMGSAFKGLAGMFAGAMAGLAVGNFLKDSVAEARESQKVGALTASIIKSTGGAAKLTAKQVGDLSTAISNKTGVDDEAIQAGANLLLTFKNVRNEVGKGANIFDRATAAAADLSAAGFGDMANTSKQLGKALNDPIKGISALGRAGVTFTEQQKNQIKEMVKVGDVLGAQKIILGEVESQVGGAAAASATAGEKMSVAWGNFKEQIGEKLLPILDKFANWFVKDGLPAIVKFGGWLEDELLPVLGRVGGWVKDNVLPVFQRLGDWFTETGLPAVKSFGGWIKDELWPALKRGYDTIMPGLRTALDIVQGGKGKGGVDGVGVSFKDLGKILTEKVIPFVAKFFEYYLPLLATQLRVVMETVQFLWAAFQTWKDIVLLVISTLVRKFLDFVGTFVNGAAKAFGWMPGIGDKLKTAAAEFNKFKDKVNASLDAINDKKVNVGVAFVAGSRVVLSSNSTGGGSTKFATGGVLPGYTPGRDVHQFYSATGGRLDLSGGEAIMRPEFTRLVGGKAGVDALNAQARAGSVPFQGFASGGVFARVPSGRGIREGVDSATLDVVSKSAKMLQQAAQAMAGGPGMGWRAMVAWAKANIPGAAVTSTVRRGDKTSDHYSGRAIDLAGGPGMSRIFDRISGAFPTSNVRSLYYSPKGGNQIRFNRRSNTPPHIYSSHFDHVHWAMKNGGVIPGRENGGPVLAGRPYVVGEKRPELFVPDTNGTILPSVGAGGTTVFQTFLDGKVVAEVVMDHTGRILSGGRTVLAS